MKPRVAFFDFASCEGCQLQIANLEEEVLDVASVVDVVSFREVMKEHSEPYDIVFIEGSIQRPMDEERIKAVRAKAGILVAMGACACLGGVQRLNNEWPAAEVLGRVYSKNPGGECFEYTQNKAVDEVVKVDAYLPGCPINRDEFKRLVTDVAQGKKWKLPNYPVCVECKKNENVCVFELGGFCMGPVTRAGCNSACPNFGSGCEGCRGYLPEPKMDAEKAVLEKYHVTVEQMLERFNMYNFGRQKK